ncbi:MAG: hypothetical protein NDI94_02555 [Candidatus Woesearchaeota archaeon]|nr:hypothetical protein [Candidatus Woesearchaeota archaeon]
MQSNFSKRPTPTYGPLRPAPTYGQQRPAPKPIPHAGTQHGNDHGSSHNDHNDHHDDHGSGHGGHDNGHGSHGSEKGPASERIAHGIQHEFTPWMLNLVFENKWGKHAFNAIGGLSTYGTLVAEKDSLDALLPANPALDFLGPTNIMGGFQVLGYGISVFADLDNAEDWLDTAKYAYFGLTGLAAIGSLYFTDELRTVVNFFSQLTGNGMIMEPTGLSAQPFLRYALWAAKTGFSDVMYEFTKNYLSSYQGDTAKDFFLYMKTALYSGISRGLNPMFYASILAGAVEVASDLGKKTPKGKKFDDFLNAAESIAGPLMILYGIGQGVLAAFGGGFNPASSLESMMLGYDLWAAGDSQMKKGHGGGDDHGSSHGISHATNHGVTHYGPSAGQKVHEEDEGDEYSLDDLRDYMTSRQPLMRPYRFGEFAENTLEYLLENRDEVEDVVEILEEARAERRELMLEAFIGAAHINREYREIIEEIEEGLGGEDNSDDVGSMHPASASLKPVVPVSSNLSGTRGPAPRLRYSLTAFNMYMTSGNVQGMQQIPIYASQTLQHLSEQPDDLGTVVSILSKAPEQRRDALLKAMGETGNHQDILGNIRKALSKPAQPTGASDAAGLYNGKVGYEEFFETHETDDNLGKLATSAVQMYKQPNKVSDRFNTYMFLVKYAESLTEAGEIDTPDLTVLELYGIMPPNDRRINSVIEEYCDFMMPMAWFGIRTIPPDRFGEVEDAMIQEAFGTVVDIYIDRKLDIYDPFVSILPRDLSVIKRVYSAISDEVFKNSFDGPKQAAYTSFALRMKTAYKLE